MKDMLTQRLISHGLGDRRFSTPAEVVQHYGCLQAQDVLQAKRCLGSRVAGSSLEDIQAALATGQIVRTRPMRGTLHYLDPEIVHGMLNLCAAKTLSGFAKRREFLGISDAYAETALELMERALKGGISLTRSQIGEVLQEGGIPLQSQRVYHLTCYAATRKLICFGPPNEKDETFVLLNERLPHPPTLTHEEQLAELARRYLRSHGPATADDLARRTGLGKGVCKQAIALVEKEFEQILYAGKVYYFCPLSSPSASSVPGVRLLGGFDEYFIGYKDRSIVADVVHHGKLFTKNGIFFPLIMQDGEIVGSRKRVRKKDTAVITLDLLSGYKVDRELLQQAAEQYAQFRGTYEVIIK